MPEVPVPEAEGSTIKNEAPVVTSVDEAMAPVQPEAGPSNSSAPPTASNGSNGNADPSSSSSLSKSEPNQQTGSQRPPQQQQRSQPHKSRNALLPRLTSDELRHRLQYISSGSTVILKMPSGRTKSAEIIPGKQVSLGKFGSFKADDVIGMPYGFTYEIQPSSQSQSSSSNNGSSLKLVMNHTLTELEDIGSEETKGATNEHINDDGDAQKLTYIDIQELKNKGVTGRQIIEQQLAGSGSFASRTVFSQAKYVARKEQKHLKLFTPLQPDFGNICDFWFEKSAEKIRWIRKDALAQTLSFGSVRPGGRYLVVDGVSGLLAGAVLERLGGDGTVIAINDAESPPAFDILPYFNFPTQLTKGVLKVMNWAATDEDYAPVFSQQEGTSKDDGVSVQTQPNVIKNAKDRSRIRKRAANIREVDSVRNDFFRGDFDAILIACHYDPLSILHKVKDRLAGSASVVVHSPYLQPLVEAHAKLRSEEEFIDISITEPWLRRYQVLPGRTHPEMTTSSTAGFILHALRVFSDTKALELRRQYLESLKSPPNKSELADGAVATNGNDKTADGVDASVNAKIRKTNDSNTVENEDDAERSAKRTKTDSDDPIRSTAQE